jgi:aspartyl-tRNA(Asn)/glutamyl-tRNA(Gln) amidotransferase subunit B
VNVSVNREGQAPGTRCEIKNLNSLRFMVAAISNALFPSIRFFPKSHTPRFSGSEAHRQIDILDSGGPVQQETLGFNEDTGKTYTLRNKENTPDYRYMPDPNLPPLLLTPVRRLALAPHLLADLPLGRNILHPFAMRCLLLPTRLENA